MKNKQRLDQKGALGDNAHSSFVISSRAAYDIDLNRCQTKTHEYQRGKCQPRRSLVISGGKKGWQPLGGRGEHWRQRKASFFASALHQVHFAHCCQASGLHCWRWLLCCWLLPASVRSFVEFTPNNNNFHYIVFYEFFLPLLLRMGSQRAPYLSARDYVFFLKRHCEKDGKSKMSVRNVLLFFSAFHNSP